MTLNEELENMLETLENRRQAVDRIDFKIMDLQSLKPYALTKDEKTRLHQAILLLEEKKKTIMFCNTN